MKKLFLTLPLAFVALVMFAQFKGPSISFDNQNHNYGDIPEDGGIVTYKFEFANTGSEPLILTKVEPSCGCTTSDYTRNPVGPGEKGYVSASYNPAGRPNAFNKTITVTCNGEPGMVVLRIQGNVLPKAKTVEDDYPRSIGGLRMKTDHLAFMKIYSNVVKTDTIEVINTGSELLKVTFTNVPMHLKITTSPEIFKPNEKGSIIVTYSAKDKNDWGFVMDNITVVTNGQENPKNRLTVSADIQEDFSAISEKDRRNAPVASFEEKVYNFGTIKQGEITHYDFKLTNNGKSDLVIRKTKASCGCTASQPDKNVIKPGETTLIKTSFNSTGKSGMQNKTITVTTNDPVNPSIELKISGTIEVPAPNQGQTN